MDEEILKGKTLVVVDDETDLRDIVASELEFMGATVHQAQNITEAQKLIKDHPVDLVISDIRMPGGTGIDLLDAVKAMDVNVPPVVLITGFADITLEDALNKGAEALLNKPFKLDDLIKLAGKYTSPFQDRFKESLTETKALEAQVDKDHVLFGRGGVAFSLAPNQKFESGDNISFELDLDNQHYSGTGVCRWFKNQDQGAGQSAIGLEFSSLTDDSLGHFMSKINGQSVVPYIPSIKV